MSQELMRAWLPCGCWIDGGRYKVVCKEHSEEGRQAGELAAKKKPTAPFCSTCGGHDNNPKCKTATNMCLDCQKESKGTFSVSGALRQVCPVHNKQLFHAKAREE